VVSLRRDLQLGGGCSTPPPNQISQAVDLRSTRSRRRKSAEMDRYQGRGGNGGVRTICPRRTRTFAGATGKIPMKRNCSLSTETLNDLYWRGAKSLREIARIEADSNLSPACEKTVKRWLITAGINIKTRSERQSQTIRARADKTEWNHAGVAEAAARKHAEPRLVGVDHLHAPGMRRRAKTGRRKQAERDALKSETRLCDNCGAKIVKKPHRFTDGFTTCSRKCRQAYLAKLKQFTTPPIKRVCEFCLGSFEVPPSRLKYGPARYCSRACSNKGRAKTK